MKYTLIMLLMRQNGFCRYNLDYRSIKREVIWLDAISSHEPSLWLAAKEEVRDLEQEDSTQHCWPEGGGGHIVRNAQTLQGPQNSPKPTTSKEMRISVLKLPKSEFCPNLNDPGSKYSPKASRREPNLANTLILAL